MTPEQFYTLPLKEFVAMLDKEQLEKRIREQEWKEHIEELKKPRTPQKKIEAVLSRPKVYSLNR
jgi:hypothetical protein